MRNLMAEFGLYFLTSVVGLVIDLGLLFVLTEFVGLHYLVSATISFLAGLVVVYFLSVKLVFRARQFSSSRIEFPLFALIGVIGLILNNLGLWLLTDLSDIFYLTSKVLVAGGVFTWNFSARKVFLFRLKKGIKEIDYVDRI